MPQTYTNKSGQKITTYYAKEEQEGYIPPAQKERRERTKDISTPLGRVEQRIFGDTPITRTGRRAVGKVRERAGNINKDYIAPAYHEAKPFFQDFSTMMRAPMVRTPIYDKKGKQTGTRKTRGSQPTPFNLMAAPTYFGGVPGMQPERRTKKKKGKHEREEDTGGMWEGMMGIPEHAKRWM